MYLYIYLSVCLFVCIYISVVKLLIVINHMQNKSFLFT